MKKFKKRQSKKLANPKAAKLKKDDKLEKILDKATKSVDKKNGVKEPVIPESTVKKAAAKGPATTKTTDEALPKTPAAPKNKKKAAKAKAAAKKAATAAKPAAKAAAASAAQKGKVEHPPAN